MRELVMQWWRTFSRARLLDAIDCGGGSRRIELARGHMLSVAFELGREFDGIVKDEAETAMMIDKALQMPEGSPGREWSEAMLVSWRSAAEGVSSIDGEKTGRTSSTP